MMASSLLLELSHLLSSLPSQYYPHSEILTVLTAVHPLCVAFCNASHVSLASTSAATVQLPDFQSNKLKFRSYLVNMSRCRRISSVASQTVFRHCREVSSQVLMR